MYPFNYESTVLAKLKKSDFLADILDNVEETRYSYKARSPKTVTEKEFNHHYWAIANDLLSKEEIGVLNSSIGKLNSGEHFNKNADGFYMIPVGEKGVLNKIVFTNGKRNSYSIDTVIKINLDNETDLSIERGIIYASERKGIYTETNEIVEVFYAKDFKYSDFKRNLAKDTQDSNGKQNRTRNNGKIKISLSIGNETVNGSVKETNNLVALHDLPEKIKFSYAKKE